MSDLIQQAISLFVALFAIMNLVSDTSTFRLTVEDKNNQLMLRTYSIDWII